MLDMCIACNAKRVESGPRTGVLCPDFCIHEASDGYVLEQLVDERAAERMGLMVDGTVQEAACLMNH
jgi:hypothetical protein